VLACAVAFADEEVTSDENSLLNDFADALGIDEARSEELMRMLVRN
jgi:tellurite resistance protein